MNSNRNLWIAVVVVIIAVIWIGVSYPKTPTEISIDKIVNEVKAKLNFGSLTGPDIQSEYLCVNGVCRYFYKTPLAQSTSTVCAIKSPAATSTLSSGSLHINVNTTASTAVIGKATTAFATTTKLGQAGVAAGAELNLVASTSPITDGATTFSPNTYLVASLEGSGLVNLTGTCQAIFTQIAN